MVAALLRLTGLDKKLEELKRDLQGRADSAVDHLKAVAVQFATAAGLIFSAGIFGLLAVITALIAVYIWAEATWGPYAALAIVGAALAAAAVGLLLAGLSAARGATESSSTLPVAPPARQLPPPQLESLRMEAAAAGTAQVPSANMVEPFLSLARRYARLPKTGFEPVDAALRGMGPGVEVTANEAVRRAAFLVQTGDRATVLAVLGAAAALGWLMVRSVNDKASN